jgi:hypothetical protein
MIRNIIAWTLVAFILWLLFFAPALTPAQRGIGL